MMPKAVRVLSLLAAVLLAGCLGSEPTIPPEKFYRLAPPAQPAVAPAVAGAVVLALEPVQARGVFVESQLLYRSTMAGAPLQQYPYASWAEPPDVMLEDQLVSCLRGAFGASRVLLSGQRGAWDIRVSMRLHAMEQIRDGSAAHAHFAATYTAFDRNGGVLFVLDWNREAAATGASPLEFVNALSGLVNEADRDLVERLQQVEARAPAAP